MPADPLPLPASCPQFASGSVTPDHCRTRPFPYGTLVVNVVGCVCLGLLTGAALNGTVGQVVDTGLIGAFTTFSTWMVDTHRLAEDRRLPMAVVNLLVSLVLGGAGAWAGYVLGARL